MDVTQTHTVGAWAWRDVGDERHIGNAVLNFRPDGADVTEVRAIVTTQACNQCHNPLKAHDGLRRDADLCVTCHSQGQVDPDTGNSIDMFSMVHKIHRGESLYAQPFQIIGEETEDYSTVAYPQPLQQCEACHKGQNGDVWKKMPTKVNCTSCHDDISFSDPPDPAMVAHLGGPQADDSDCHVCHTPGALGLESIYATHLTPFTDPDSPIYALEIVSLESTGPSQTPQIVFKVTKDGQPLDILAAPLTRLAVTVAGPTTDYASYTTYTIQGSGASGTLATDPNGFRYTLPTAMAAGATGTYAFGFEGYSQATPADPRYAIHNTIALGAVTDATPVPRRQIVTTNQCNACHSDLQGHGGSRRDTEYCAFCHNPNNVNDERVARFETGLQTAHSVDFRTMIHKIHMGEKLTQQPYVLGGFPAPTAANPGGTPLDFGEVRFPGDQRACGTCHVAGSFDLPLPSGLLPTHEQILQCNDDPSADADAYCSSRSVIQDIVTGPTASACLACHDAPETRAHAMTNTDSSTGIEACATCHSAGDAFDAANGHALDP